MEGLTLGIGSDFDGSTFVESSYTSCASNISLMSSYEVRYIHCVTPVSGRYFSVYILGDANLILSEIELFSKEGKIFTKEDN